VEVSSVCCQNHGRLTTVGGSPVVVADKNAYAVVVAAVPVGLGTCVAEAETANANLGRVQKRPCRMTLHKRQTSV